MSGWVGEWVGGSRAPYDRTILGVVEQNGGVQVLLYDFQSALPDFLLPVAGPVAARAHAGGDLEDVHGADLAEGPFDRLFCILGAVGVGGWVGGGEGSEKRTRTVVGSHRGAVVLWSCGAGRRPRGAQALHRTTSLLCALDGWVSECVMRRGGRKAPPPLVQGDQGVQGRRAEEGDLARGGLHGVGWVGVGVIGERGRKEGRQRISEQAGEAQRGAVPCP